MSVLGLGAALGTWWVNGRGRSWSRPALLGGGLVLVGIAMVVFAVTTRFAVFSIAAFLVGLFAAPAFVLTETLLQEGSDLEHRGRIFSLRDFLMRLVFMGSVAVAGTVSRAYGAPAALLVAAGCMVIAGVATFVLWRHVPAPGGPAAYAEVVGSSGSSIPRRSRSARRSGP
jgi:sugar phosphate permease